MKLDDGLIYYDHRIYIPQDHALRGEIIAASHDHITVGHPGIEKTKELILQEYWWPQDEEGHRKLCLRLRNMPTNQVKHSSKSSAPSSKHHPLPTLDSHLHRHGHWFTKVQRSRHYLNDHRPILQRIIPITCTTELSSEGGPRFYRTKFTPSMECPR